MSEGCRRELREGGEYGGEGAVGTCGTNLKTIDVHNGRQKIVVRGIKKS